MAKKELVRRTASEIRQASRAEAALRPFSAPSAGSETVRQGPPSTAPAQAPAYNIGAIPALAPADCPPIQAKLTVTPAGDQYEQEADRIAATVMRQIGALSAPPAETAQRKQDDDVLVLRKASGAGLAVAPEVETAIQAAQGGGSALDASVRAPMERAFGHSFASVRVHADGEADRLNRAVSARAFTAGRDIFFRRGEYRPGSSAGRELLAHELTHVVQQGGTAPMIQRLVVRLRNKVDAIKEQTWGAVGDDPTELNSIAFALKRTNGPVVNITEANFKQVRDGEIIYLIGHGSEGSSKGYDAAQISKYLLDEEKGIPRGLKEITIFFMSCYAGANIKNEGGRESEKEHSSQVAILSQLLKSAGSEIAVIGATGPTAKANSLGDKVYVAVPNRSSNELLPEIERQLGPSENITAAYKQWYETYKKDHDQVPDVEQRAKKYDELLAKKYQMRIKLGLEKGYYFDFDNLKVREQVIRVYIDGASIETELKHKIIENALRRKW